MVSQATDIFWSDSNTISHKVFKMYSLIHRIYLRKGTNINQLMKFLMGVKYV